MRSRWSSVLVLLSMALGSGACASAVGGGTGPADARSDTPSSTDGRVIVPGEAGVSVDGDPPIEVDAEVPIEVDGDVPVDPTLDVPVIEPDAPIAVDVPVAVDAARDAGFPTAPDGAVIYPADAGYDPGVRCGMMTCAATQECCPDRMTRALTCVTRGMCMGPSATCDGPEDCPSAERCCLGSRTTMVACMAPSECRTFPVVGAITPCHTNADCPATARRCCDVSGRGFGGFMIPAGIPKVCSPVCF